MTPGGTDGRLDADLRPLQGRHLLVIGASAGIGRATALEAARHGADVVVTGRRRDRLDALVEEMGCGAAIDADLQDPLQCDSLVDRAVEAVGTVDALVFAASAATLSLLKEADASVWRTVLETNVMAPALVTRRLLPHLTDRAFLGYLSSEVVGQPYHGLTHYAASKAALEELIRGLRVEHPEARFCCIRVGATIDTEFSREFSSELTAELLPHWIARAKLPATFMTSADLGQAIVRGVAMALATPGIDVQDLTLRPAGGTLTGDLSAVVAAAGEVGPGSVTDFVEAGAPRMLPALTDVNRAYWTGGRSGQLLITRCRDCRRWVLPVLATCPGCGGPTDPEPVSGRGRVFTYTVNAKQFHPDVPAPNLIAIVQLDEQEDLRIATNLVHCREVEVHGGLPVRVRFEPQGEVYYPVFEPVRETA